MHYFKLLLCVLSLLRCSSDIFATDDELCACSSDVCNCLRTNITNIALQVTQKYCTPKLTRLIISDNKLAQIGDGAFENSQCNALTEIAIRKTKIATITKSAFAGLPLLKTLNIGDNNITSISKDAFSVLAGSLVTLNLESNGLKSLNNRSFYQLSSLETLNLASNKIGYIHNRTFQNCKKLKRLVLANNILTEIEPEMFYGLENLEYLSMEQNPILRITKDSFKYLPKLKTLLLSHTDKEYYGGFSKLPKQVFFSMNQLRTLNISGLKLTTVDDQTFYGLGELEHLSLRGNRITNVSRNALNNLQKLKKLDLADNRIHCLQPASFSDLNFLRQLDLSGNSISYVGTKALEGLDNLHLLNLDRNPIRVVEKNAFCNFRSLLLLQIDTLLGKVAYDAVHSYADSAFAKLPKPSRIFGVSMNVQHGMEQPCLNTSTPDPMYNSTDCLIAMGKDLNWFGDDPRNGSRKYLLIIVAICVSFLLIAFAIIMTYRAWSKHKMTDDPEDQAEKQEMLERGTPGQTAANTGPAGEFVNGGNGMTAVINHQPKVKEKTPPAPESVPNGGTQGSTEQPAPLDNIEAHPQQVVNDANGATITTFGVV